MSPAVRGAAAREPRRATHGWRPEPPNAPAQTSSFDELGFLQHVFVHLPEGIVIVDGSGKVLWGNRSAERMFGRSMDDWVGRSGLDLVHPDDQEFALRSLTTILEKDVGTPIEIRINAASGWRLVEIVGTHRQWCGQNVVLLCLRDLTERRRFELASGREAPLPLARAQRRVRDHAGIARGHSRVGVGCDDTALGTRPRIAGTTALS